ncbi:MAG: hypothetical protein GC206_15785 [Alphaproteobacteria bacterium]|nr:hypothetical protein [Alphaproteobacteria bacterium]
MTHPDYREPTTQQLVEAAAGFLEAQLPNLDGRAAFHGRVAVNVLGIVARELALGPAAAAREREGLKALLKHDGTLAELRAELCGRIRAGQLTQANPMLLDHLLRTVADRVAIEQPRYGSLKLAGA